MTDGTRSSDSGRPVPTGPRRRLLYVEDDHDIWRITQHRLRAKYDLVHAASDRDACRLLVDEGDTFHAVLMDIELRGSTLDGLQLTRLLRGRLSADETPEFARSVAPSDLPVIIVSAYVGAHDERDMIAAGANRVLVKPVDFVDLTMTLIDSNLKQARRSLRPPAA